MGKIHHEQIKSQMNELGKLLTVHHKKWLISQTYIEFPEIEKENTMWKKWIKNTDTLMGKDVQMKERITLLKMREYIRTAVEQGQLGGSVVKNLTPAQVMIPGS